jgi:AraC-like DNA-binding protein
LSPFSEARTWQPVQNGWRPLFGSFYESGVSLEWHDFQVTAPFEWSRSFHPDSLELCLNLGGTGTIQNSRGGMDFQPFTAGFYAPGQNALKACRSLGQHRFLTVEFSAAFLRQHLGGCDGALHPLVEAFVQGGTFSGGVGEVHRLQAGHEQLIGHLIQPPVSQSARRLWYQSKVLQLMAEFFFERRDDELLCDRQKRMARDRVQRVVAILRRRLAEPPSLEDVGREVGCSPFYLSRTFSRETGMTIPQYLRKLRMERAAELLRNGSHNVTEAALEVGYSSLSHFSQAFCQTMGCCPGLYPLRAPGKEVS